MYIDVPSITPLSSATPLSESTISCCRMITSNVKKIIVGNETLEKKKKKKQKKTKGRKKKQKKRMDITTQSNHCIFALCS